MSNPSITMLALSKLHLPADDLRTRVNPAKLEELRDSIRAQGIIEPLIVAAQDGGYRIIAGGRRYRAAKLAGLNLVPCIIRAVDVGAEREIRLIENLQREDLSVLEKARGYAAFMDATHANVKQLAKRLAVTHGHVSQVLAVLRLPPTAQKLVAAGRLNLSHARELNRIRDAKQGERFARRLERALDAKPTPRAEDLRLKVDRLTGKASKRRARAGASKTPKPAPVIVTAARRLVAAIAAENGTPLESSLKVKKLAKALAALLRRA
jgi:ParB/RepB/Spo0J family partition protein